MGARVPKVYKGLSLTYLGLDTVKIADICFVICPRDHGVIDTAWAWVASSPDSIPVT